MSLALHISGGRRRWFSGWGTVLALRVAGVGSGGAAIVLRVVGIGGALAVLLFGVLMLGGALYPMM